MIARVSLGSFFGGAKLKRCAGGILFQDGQILLGKRAFDRELYPDTWDIIGGHCLPGEPPPQTLIRELQEEIDVTPTAFSKLAVLYEPQPHLYGELEYHVYLVTQWVGRGPTNVQKEHSQVRWFPVDQALQLDLAHPGCIDLFKSIRRNLELENDESYNERIASPNLDRLFGEEK